MLVIEVYGGYHSERTQQEDDAVRQQWLESIGYKVIRFSNEEILFNLDNTIKIIMYNLQGSDPPPKQVFCPRCSGDRGGAEDRGGLRPRVSLTP
jgi:very-short-patch-repair endonuclease